MKESVTQNKRCAFEDSGVCCFSVTLLQVNYLHCRNFTTFIITVDHQVTDVVGLLLFFNTTVDHHPLVSTTEIPKHFKTIMVKTKLHLLKSCEFGSLTLDENNLHAFEASQK